MSAATKVRSARARATIAIRMLKTVRHLGRSFDDCFEMYDGEEVVRIIVARAARDAELARLIHERGFSNWFRQTSAVSEQKYLFDAQPLDPPLVLEDLPAGFGPEIIPLYQVAVYTMCGGGFLGHFAAEQPADFYIDERVGRLPYGRTEIYRAVAILARIAELRGLNPHGLPPLPLIHSFGILRRKITCFTQDASGPSPMFSRRKNSRRNSRSTPGAPAPGSV